MLDREATRRRFNQWVGSPAFDKIFNGAVKRSIWPYVVGAVLIVSVAGAPLGIGFVILGLIKDSKRRKARRQAGSAFIRHEPVLCALVIGNTDLFRKKDAVAPALLVGGFGQQDEVAVGDALAAAFALADLYGEEPAGVPAELRRACELVNDDTFRPDRRRKVPKEISPNRDLWMFDAVLSGGNFDSGLLDESLIPCMASPGERGTIMQLPQGVAVIQSPKHRSPTIHHKRRETPPPLVAPVSENLDEIEKHIERHLGEPSLVFHELVSTTVHIDVHIVPSGPGRPWVSLVTSGMSDLPMNAPEGAEGFRLAELMIRLPADWKLDEESLKDESNYWPIRRLKSLARFVHEYETWLSHGHSIPNGNPPEPFAENAPFTGVVLSPPWFGDGDFASMKLKDGNVVHFWSLIPVHPSEMDFKLEYGADALFEKLASAGFGDIVVRERPPVV